MKKLLWTVFLGLILSILGLTFISSAAPPSGFVYRQGSQLYLDGKPYYFAGCNCYDLFTHGDGSNTSTTDYIENYFMNKGQIDTLMSQMASYGVKVVRTWAFSHETWHGFETAKGQYNEAEFMEFDYILESAKKNGLKVIVTLENFWEAYGGIDTRLAWEGLPGKSYANRAVFFTNQNCKDDYKNFVRHMVTRINHYTNTAYRDDPTIFSWELMNEPRYQDAGENTTGITMRAWVDEMAGYIKTLDPNHMVSAGLEGQQISYGYGGDCGNPFIYIHQSPDIDFCTAHPYPDESWSNLTVGQTQKLIDAWISDAQEVVGKPFVMEEWNVHNNKDQYWPAMLGEIENRNAAGSLFWNFNDIYTGDFDMLEGDAVLAGVFKPHAQRMAAKSGTVVTPTPTASPTPTVTPSPTPGAGATVSYVIQNDWGNGATISVTLKNNGASGINGWELAWSFPGNQKITNLWNGVYNQNGTNVKVTNLSHNSAIPAGATVNFGFNVTYSGSNAKPSAFTLNGFVCTIQTR